ncbi:MAG TPA: NAD(P)-dependent alcohol dehydrogenase [Candidatus Limnocylindria bacterium]|nr:NAD(P)-dependent alcohol dehydrogenase [Candidatus Limnocylindria bacterium]
MTANALTHETTQISQMTMKAVAQHRYGSPDILQLTDIPKPEIGEDGILVRIRAASVNALDWHMMRGEPYVMRLGSGLRRPPQPIRGVDLAGVVEAVGSRVTEFTPGDEVFGTRSASWAEYVAGSELDFVKKPAGLSFEEAAALPTAGVTALQGLRDHGRLRAGQDVLVFGAGGGVGTFAVQIAKAMGATVTAVTRSESVELVRSLGADQVIDYTRNDVFRSPEKFDLVMDVGATRSISDLRRVLRPGGTLVLTGGAPGRWVGPLLHPLMGVLRAKVLRQRIGVFIAKDTKEDFLALKDLVEAGKLRPVVGATFPLVKAAEAMRQVDSGRARGKVVITV